MGVSVNGGYPQVVGLWENHWNIVGIQWENNGHMVCNPKYNSGGYLVAGWFSRGKIS